MSEPGRILVTGATGTVGSHLVRCLADLGVPVRAASRNPSTSGDTTGHVETARMDLREPMSTAAALEGVERLFLATPLEQDMAELAARVVDQARHAGLRQVVRLSAFGAGGRASTRLAAVHEQTEARLRESGLVWASLRANAFMQNFLTQFADSIRRADRFSACQADGRVSFIDARDVAAAAACLLTAQSPPAQACFELTGSQALSNDDVARVLSRVLGRRIRYVDMQPGETRAALRAHGMSAWLTDIVMELYALSAAGGASAVTSDVAKLLGRPPIAFETFVADHADAFR